ncbi:YheV family putative zinc ribbon protein [Neptunomonas antarctica]|uniref:Uncharacterized protein n=1 Tax=Neptunomonas antarctica TaxID=619304 RepID=A0A1N7IUR5_9GAMM|nr:YheV family putative zinc ribbon protein [Neptunomonas antarctica]SIS40849.1 hypothetical protein SAMN05421760_101164 [Neptunomonas antarctica]
MTVIKRFVAGAVCPRCGEMDTIRIYRNEIREYRECVKCDYVNGQNIDGSPDEAELETRVNKKPDPAPTSKPLMFVPNPALKKKDSK